MPGGDQTGPMGRGPMTGRAAGTCGGYDAPGWANPVPRRGIGMGQGRTGAWGGGRGRRGRRNWYYATGVPGWARLDSMPAWGYGPYAAAPSREEETEMLRRQAEWLKQKLDAIEQRIEELGKE